MVWQGLRGRKCRRLGQALVGSAGGRLGAVGGVGLVEDVPHVVAHRSETDNHFLGNLTAGLSGGYKAAHFYLSMGQTGEIRRRWRRLGLIPVQSFGYPLHISGSIPNSVEIAKDSFNRSTALARSPGPFRS